MIGAGWQRCRALLMRNPFAPRPGLGKERSRRSSHGDTRRRSPDLCKDSRAGPWTVKVNGRAAGEPTAAHTAASLDGPTPAWDAADTGTYAMSSGALSLRVTPLLENNANHHPETPNGSSRCNPVRVPGDRSGRMSPSVGPSRAVRRHRRRSGEDGTQTVRSSNSARLGLH